MTTTTTANPCPALSERARTFASIQHAAGALGLPVEAIRLAKHRGCSAFRPNGNVSERDLIEWFLVECWEFWGDLLPDLDSEAVGIFPPEALEWRKTPPAGLDALAIKEGEFQWLRLIHGDAITGTVKAGAESALAKLASEIPAYLAATAEPPPPIEAFNVEAEIVLGYRPQPAGFPETIPAWRLDADPFAVIQAHRVEFWQWSEEGVREWCRSGKIPAPPKFLVIPDRDAESQAFPPGMFCDILVDGRIWHAEYGTPRSLLDFLPPAAATAPPPRGEREQRGKGQRKPRATR
jgi:hypothetical protein